MLSSYILFKNFSIHSHISIRLRENFTSSKVKGEIQKLQFQTIDERTSNYLERGGNTKISSFKEKKFIHIHFSEEDGVNPIFFYFSLKLFNNSILILLT